MEDSSSKTPFNINDMPPEIILHVLHFLDVPAPSELRLYEQPSDTLLDTEPELLSLKPASLVCRYWRSLALPKLFRHVLWRPQVSSLTAFTLNPIPLLRFIEDNKLDRSVHTFTLLVDFVDERADAHRRTPQIRSVDLEWFWDQLFSVLDPLRFTIIAPPTTLAAFLSRMLFLDDAWSFDMPYHILSLSRAKREAHLPAGSHLDVSLSDLRLSAAKSDGEGSQPSSSIATAAAAAGPSRASVSSPQPKQRAPPCPLFTVRRWTALLLNEGSSTKVYRTYEFFLRRPPSMLGALLGCEEWPNDAPLVPPSVTDLSYVAIFPLSSHVDMLARHLPRVDRLFLRLTPGAGAGSRSRGGILDDPDEMRHVDLADLWMERDSAYGCLMREIMAPAARWGYTVADIIDGTWLSLGSPSGNGNWASLRVFESGDERDALDQARRLLVNGEVHGWRLEGNGRILVRCCDDDEEEDGDGVRVAAAA